MPDRPISVGFFVTCLVDFFRPSVGFAAIKLLEDAGCRVAVPDGQTCCGQPAYNSGDSDNARRVARQVVQAFVGYDYVVAPSGSCAGMIRVHDPDLLKDDELAEQARELAGKTYELTSFLTDILGVDGIASTFDGTVTYHDSCSGLRELGICEQPRRLLAGVEGLELKELSNRESCCGFGGSFCVKYPEISVNMVAKKTADIVASGGGTVLGGDLGCLLNIAGKLKRDGESVKVRHVAEVLAGQTNHPAIGDGD